VFFKWELLLKFAVTWILDGFYGNSDHDSQICLRKTPVLMTLEKLTNVSQQTSDIRGVFGGTALV